VIARWTYRWPSRQQRRRGLIPEWAEGMLINMLIYVCVEH